jgi:hypothetical protein
LRDFLCVAALLAGLALVPACESDPAQPGSNSSGNTQSFLPLNTPDAVLNNIEVAWDNRVPSRIDELLDENFFFYFAPGDVGGEIPEQWDRATELAVTTALLNSNTVPPVEGPVCREVRVDLFLDEVEWVPLAPPADAPGEAWQTAIVYYECLFEMEPDFTYIAGPGAKAKLTVREIPVGNATEWRLIEWRDLGYDFVAGAIRNAGASESTWGGIKALYQ